MLSTQLRPYMGTLILDTQARRAFLGQRKLDGTNVRTLLMLDTGPVGGFDSNQVLAAYRYFSTKDGITDGSPITVTGFWSYPTDSDVPVLHVIRG